MAFGLLKQDFYMGQWVRMGNMPTDCELNGMLGRIIGVTNRTAECDFYIVLLSERLSYSDVLALPMIESCLEPAPDVEYWRMYPDRASINGSDLESRAVSRLLET